VLRWSCWGALELNKCCAALCVLRCADRRKEGVKNAGASAPNLTAPPRGLTGAAACQPHSAMSGGGCVKLCHEMARAPLHDYAL